MIKWYWILIIVAAFIASLVILDYRKKNRNVVAPITAIDVGSGDAVLRAKINKNWADRSKANCESIGGIWGGSSIGCNMPSNYKAPSNRS